MAAQPHCPAKITAGWKINAAALAARGADRALHCLRVSHLAIAFGPKATDVEARLFKAGLCRPRRRFLADREGGSKERRMFEENSPVECLVHEVGRYLHSLKSFGQRNLGQNILAL